MAFDDDLLDQAFELVHKDPNNPKQASLRRAVSTAYYAVFHLLICESTANWNQQHLRTTLGRAFDHGLMKTACNRICDRRVNPFTHEDRATVAHLEDVARAFIQLQERRHVADYDNTTVWLNVEALAQVKLAEETFKKPRAIRSDLVTEAFRVSLLVKTRA